jgi:hypothetical protein
MPAFASPVLMNPGNQEWPWHARPESGMDFEGNTLLAGTDVKLNPTLNIMRGVRLIAIETRRLVQRWIRRG